jgi:putative ABC transport system permease protein
MSRASRFFNLFRRRALDRELDEELTFHVEMLIDKYTKQGLTRDEAERRARRHAGNTLLAKEDMREVHIMMWIDSLARDLVYGARMFLRQPGTSFLAVVTLSLGIGANTVIYSLLHAALIRPLPFPSPDRLVAVVDNFVTQNQVDISPTVPETLDVRAASRTLDPVSFYDTRDVQINGGTEPVRAISARIEADFLRTLGVQPALGRIFSAGDHEQGRDRVVILSDAFWRRNFGADPNVIDRAIIVNAAPHTVVGVLPPGVNFDYFTAEPIELYVPYPMTPDYTSRTGSFSSVRRVIAIARVRDTATIEQADAELRTIGQRLKGDHPQLYRRGSDGQDLGFTMGATPLRRLVLGRGARTAVLVLFAAVGLVLLIACANTAQFLMARAIERRPEVVVRSALGASTGRLMRQFLTEAFLFAAVATALGVLQASALVGVLRALIGSPSPLIGQLGLNVQVILFTVLVTVLVTVMSGLFPALHLVRQRVIAGDASRLTGTTRSRTRHAMIAAQVAASVVLLVAALLVATGLRQLQDTPTGYEPDGVTMMRLRAAGRPDPRGTGGGYQQYLQALSSVPGLSYAAIADGPLQGFAGTEFSIVGRADDAATLSLQRAGWAIVSPDYFTLLGIPLRAGRTFTDSDSVDAPQVIVINDVMARRFWLDQNPIGQQIKSGTGPRLRVATIVGVVGDVRPTHRLEVPPQIYTSYLQQSEPNATLLVKTAAGQGAPIDAIKQAIRAVVPEQAIFDIRPLTNVIAQSTNTPRLMTQLLGSFAGLAVALAMLGVYTVVSYVTARRTREVALRRAIGATPNDVLRLLGVPTLGWTAAGIAIGIVAAAWLTRLVPSVANSFGLPEESLRLDPPIIVAAMILYAIIVCVAVLAPAARALRVQPGIILRAE